MSKIDDFDINFDGLDLDEVEFEGKPEKNVNVTRGMAHRQFIRKAYSEKALENAMDWYFQEGDCYHCYSFGDVDSLSYFKHVLRQQRIKYAALSTWCIAAEDVADLTEWHRRGMIGRVDFYVGDLFPYKYAGVYALCQKFIAECGGRIVVYHNHAKVMAIKGERFDVLVESSANINTNPRSENTVVTVSTELVDHYIKLFGAINPYNKDFGAPPFEIGEQ